MSSCAVRPMSRVSEAFQADFDGAGAKAAVFDAMLPDVWIPPIAGVGIYYLQVGHAEDQVFAHFSLQVHIRIVGR